MNETIDRLIDAAGNGAHRDLIMGIASAPQRMGGFPGVKLLGDAGIEVTPDMELLLARISGLFHAEVKNRDAVPTRVEALRRVMEKQDLAGWLVAHNDHYFSEYLPVCAMRLCWLTGFSGSAGKAIVTSTNAAVFSDGRYTLQLKEQVDGALFERCHIVEQPPAEWLTNHMEPGGRVGYDPRLHAHAEIEKLSDSCARHDVALVAVEQNLIDAIWLDRPPEPISPIVAHERAFSGKGSAEKRADLASALRTAEVEAVVLTQADSIAWLLNVRGDDVLHTPMPLSFAIAHASGEVEWFVDPRKLALESISREVTVRPVDELEQQLRALGSTQKRVLVDGDTCGIWFSQVLTAAGAQPVAGSDPCTLPKACKNAVESAAIRAAHIKDGIAVTRFLAWFHDAVDEMALDEISVAQKLADFRALEPSLMGFSFDTISGAGPNGAIPHYSVTPESNRPLESGSLYVVDSGGQYKEGTTDITRTIPVGEPSGEMCSNFTLVLKGHIALNRICFPEGTSGRQLDVLARQFLWQAGLNYDHGTGHGVGAYLSVHEGPQAIAATRSDAPLMPGMVLSNEPGYYAAGRYGIRIENLIQVVRREITGGAQNMLGFEVLTYAPVDRRLIVVSMLTPEERSWVDDYHQKCLEMLQEGLNGSVLEWLNKAILPL